MEFLQLNLSSEAWPLKGPLDVRFCRNLLMYPEPARRRAMLERMASLLAPDGILILDPAERLGWAKRLFDAGQHGVFALRPEGMRVL